MVKTKKKTLFLSVTALKFQLNSQKFFETLGSVMRIGWEKRSQPGSCRKMLVFPTSNYFALLHSDHVCRLENAPQLTQYWALHTSQRSRSGGGVGCVQQPHLANQPRTRTNHGCVSRLLKKRGRFSKLPHRVVSMSDLGKDDIKWGGKKLGKENPPLFKPH